MNENPSSNQGESKQEPEQEIISLKELFEKKFVIPPYQRPYKWTEKNVLQLLEDIDEHTSSPNRMYRIGSVIIHQGEEKKKIINNIVDGQQRLTTLDLILKNLGDENGLLSLNELNKISSDNCKRNNHTIEKWLKAKSEDNKKNFLKKIKEKCEVVLFTVYNIDEAFQLFDSQNSRGLALEPFDFLKAFHLREMQILNDTEEQRKQCVEEQKQCVEEQKQCVEKWEEAINNGTLNTIINDHLFRIRKWVKKERKYEFTKEEIDEFKGVSLHQKQDYNYETVLRILDTSVKNKEITPSYPFSIMMPIINGKRFFEYIFHYIELYKKLFSEEESEDNAFYNFYKKRCKYGMSHRGGDKKVLNLYKNVLLLWVDKFGENELTEDFYEAFYKASYRIRCEKKGIYKATILNSEANNTLIPKIHYATFPKDLNSYKYLEYKIKDIDKDKIVKGIEIITDFIYKETK